MAQNTSGRRRAIDGRTTRHWGYGQRLEIRAWIETHVGWIKAAASLRQVKQRGLARVDAPLQFAMPVRDDDEQRVRLPTLIAAGASA